MTDIKVALFDVDSTLTSGINQPVVESAVQAIKQLRRKGIKVVIASGRPPYAMPSIDGKVEADYYIGSNGHIVADENKKSLFAYRLEKDVFEQINKYCKENELGIFWKFEDQVYIYNDCPLMSYVMESMKGAKYGSHPNKEETPCGGGLICPKDKIEAFQKRFNRDIDVVDGGYILYDVGIKGMNKAVGMAKLLELLDISTEQCIAFGDSDNDLEMIQLAGIGVAMGNGYDSVKKVADYITDTAADDGIVKALKKYNII